ncbi:uncharacterized protein [Leptinotarsa decemlineata]|uniref:uncharacterized protein n=1 Tax=Leptinotarsa decemlineata TaxID=7539 RepID=UPI003D30994E
MRSRDQPFLTEVMDTIASLRDSKGSPPDKILDHIVSSRRTPLKNASLQVKKALRTGLKTGLLKEVSGKFKLGLDPRDYAVFKNFRQLERSGGLPLRESRRGRKGRRKRGRSRKRRGKKKRRTHGLADELFNLHEESSPEPMDRGRRGRRRKGKGRRKRRGSRRGRRGRKHAMDAAENESDRSSHSKEVIHKSSEEKPKTAKSQQGRNDNDRNDSIRSDADKGHVDIDSLGSNHCFHGLHQENNHPYGPQSHGHYGEYYDH